MPNWCSNRLKVEGDPDALAAFIAQAKSNPDGKISVDGDSPVLSFGAFFSIPADLREVESRAGLRDRNTPLSAHLAARQRLMVSVDPVESGEISSEMMFGDDKLDWYNWSIREWGTKWDIDGSDETTIVDQDESSITYDFSTAWGPPQAFLRRLAAAYPVLTFTMLWSEQGVGAYGLVSFVDGALWSHEDWDGEVAKERFTEHDWPEAYYDDEEEDGEV